MLVYSTSSSFFLCFALLMQSGLGLDPFAAGRLFAPCSVAFVAASLMAPRWVGRWGTRVLAIGALFYAMSIGALIVQVHVAGASLVPTHLIPTLVVVGAAQAVIMTPLLNLVLGFVDAPQAGMASGVISTVQQVGAALGVAVVGILFAATLDDGGGTAAAYARAFVWGMAYNLAAAVMVCGLLWTLVRQRLSRVSCAG